MDEYEGFIRILKSIPTSREKIRNTRFISSETHPPRPNREKWQKFFDNSTWCGFVAENENGIQCMALGALASNLWDDRTIGRIVVWGAGPDTGHIMPVRVMQSLLRWFEDEQVDYIITTCDFDSIAERCYRKLGFKPLEISLYKEV